MKFLIKAYTRLKFKMFLINRNSRSTGFEIHDQIIMDVQKQIVLMQLSSTDV